MSRVDVRENGRPPIRLGLRANAAQFTILVAINALVGGMVGQQQKDTERLRWLRRAG